MVTSNCVVEIREENMIDLVITLILLLLPGFCQQNQHIMLLNKLSIPLHVCIPMGVDEKKIVSMLFHNDTKII